MNNTVLKLVTFDIRIHQKWINKKYCHHILLYYQLILRCCNQLSMSRQHWSDDLFLSNQFHCQYASQILKSMCHLSLDSNCHMDIKCLIKLFLWSLSSTSLLVRVSSNRQCWFPGYAPNEWDNQHSVPMTFPNTKLRALENLCLKIRHPYWQIQKLINCQNSMHIY